MKLQFNHNDHQLALNIAKVLKIQTELELLEAASQADNWRLSMKVLNKCYPESEYWNSGGGGMILSMKMLNIDKCPVWLHISNAYIILYKASSTYEYNDADEALRWLDTEEIDYEVVYSYDWVNHKLDVNCSIGVK